MAKPRVFLDSSVIIASLLSTTGGSFYILNAIKDDFVLQTNEYGLEEIQRILKTKFAKQPDMQSRLFLILGTSRVAILSNPIKLEVKQATKYISKIDAPILASALKNSDYLVTLDNEFLKPEILTMAAKNKLAIMKPKDFIESFKLTIKIIEIL